MVKNFIVLKATGCEYCARYELVAPLLDMDIIYWDFADSRAINFASMLREGGKLLLPFGVYKDSLFNSGRSALFNLNLFKE